MHITVQKREQNLFTTSRMVSYARHNIFVTPEVKATLGEVQFAAHAAVEENRFDRDMLDHGISQKKRMPPD